MSIKTTRTQLDWIREIWNILAFKLKISTKDSARIFQEIETRYAEPHRTYHTMIHIYQLFMLMENHPSEIKNHTLVELSILFHDIIYNPQQNDNEEKSAALADELVGKYLDASTRHELKLMIESTQLHKPILASSDNKYFLDMDTSILGVSTRIYNQYVKKIREEYRVLSREHFDLGRKDFLINFLKRPRIFYTELYHEQFEDQARENISKEISLL